MHTDSMHEYELGGKMGRVKGVQHGTKHCACVHFVSGGGGGGVEAEGNGRKKQKSMLPMLLLIEIGNVISFYDRGLSELH